MDSNMYSKYSKRIFEIIFTAITDESMQSQAKGEARDNAISAMYFLIYDDLGLKYEWIKNNPQIISNDIIKNVLNSLPLKNDMKESKEWAKFVIRVICDKNLNIFGENEWNAPEIYSAVLRVTGIHHLLII